MIATLPQRLRCCLVNIAPTPENSVPFIGLDGQASGASKSMQLFASARFLRAVPSAFTGPRIVMPRYFIDYEDDLVCLRDEEGTHYQDLLAARNAAIAALPDIGREPPPDDGRRAFTAYVRDEQGTLLCTVTLNLDTECHPEHLG